MAIKQLSFLVPVSEQIKKPTGNNRLVAHGIQNESSDYRIHVGYQCQHIVIFPTNEGKEALRNVSLNQKRSGSVDGSKRKTFSGYKVPLSSIDKLQSIMIPPLVYSKYRIVRQDSTSRKGSLATAIVVDMLKEGLIPLPLETNVVKDKMMQIKGADIILNSKLRIQVKCDYLAGEKRYGGTGNVFLQTAECNPYRQY